jgi:DNA-directed RNA polymerase sigma subunit (sigma70/sigma32)
MRKSVPYGGRAMTLDQISQELGITRERVRQIEKEAIAKIKARCERMGLKAEYILPTPFDERRQ